MPAETDVRLQVKYPQFHSDFKICVYVQGLVELTSIKLNDNLFSDSGVVIWADGLRQRDKAKLIVAFFFIFFAVPPNVRLQDHHPLYVFSVQLLNQLVDFYRIYVELHDIRSYHNFKRSNISVCNNNMADARTWEVGATLAPTRIVFRNKVWQ
jgi:hypothetical protein